MGYHGYLAFALALGLAVATPGPGILAVTSCAVARGLRHGLAMTVGLVLGDLIFFALAVLGMAALARSMGEAFLIVKLLGAAYLIWIGIKMWRAEPNADAAAADPSRSRSLVRSTMAGLFVTLGNPKVIAFYMGLLPAVVDLERLTIADGLVLAAILLAIVGGVPSTYAIAASRARRILLANERRIKLMNRTAGTALIGAGVTVAAQ